MITELTSNTTSLYISLKCFKTRVTSGMSPRQSVAFFAPNGFTSYGRGGAGAQDPQGEYCSLGLLRVLNTAPTKLLQNSLVDLYKVSARSKTMSSTSLRDRDARTIARAIRILEKSFNTEPNTQLSSPDTAKQYLRLKLSALEHEEFHAIWLNPQNKIIAIEPLFRGTLAYCQIHPREVIKSSIKHNAASVIFAHNHPSGKAVPSSADIDLTKQLKEALAIVDVRMLDHIIVAGGNICSLVERGDI
jgi:DNA repair protein RadC